MKVVKKKMNLFYKLPFFEREAFHSLFVFSTKKLLPVQKLYLRDRVFKSIISFYKMETLDTALVVSS